MATIVITCPSSGSPTVVLHEQRARGDENIYWRIHSLNTAVEKAREALPPWPWAKLKEAIHRDVKRLEDLAETLELMY